MKITPYSESASETNNITFVPVSSRHLEDVAIVPDYIPTTTEPEMVFKYILYNYYFLYTFSTRLNCVVELMCGGFDDLTRVELVCVHNTFSG